MEPLSKYGYSIWRRVYWEVYDLTPDTQAWRSVYVHLRYQFDWPFFAKDK